MVLSTVLLAMALISLVAAGPIEQNENSDFTNDLFSNLINENSNKNVIISPTSIQTAVGLAYLGAEGETAEQMRKGLHLSSKDKQVTAEKFKNLLDSTKKSQKITIANKMFVNKLYTIKKSFNQIASESFQSDAINVEFGDDNAVKTINDWVENQTNHKIKNLIQGNLAQDTSMILVNAIYFKGEWLIPFTTTSTDERSFFNYGTTETKTAMMWTEDDFNYGENNYLDCKILEMKYKDSELSMLILLPNQRDGLTSLEKNLKSFNLLKIAKELRTEDVNLSLPKFKIEFETKLNDNLKKMGMTSMFSDEADFSNIFEGGPRVKVDEVFHKAFIDVNEAGSEAAAATYLKIVPLSLNLNQKNFLADRPFLFAIKDENNIYFIGHVTNFN